MSFIAILVKCVTLFGQLVAGQILFVLVLGYQFGGVTIPADLNLHFAECSFFAVTCRGWYLIGQHVDKPGFRKLQLADVPSNFWIALAVIVLFALVGILNRMHHV